MKSDFSIIQGSTLIVPSVSVGNVPQLASDLLLHNLGFESLGGLDTKYLYPFISPIDYLETPQWGISTGLEVYYSKKHSLTLIQQRSPIITSFTKKFVDEVIVPFIEEHKLKDLLFLDSGDCGLQERVPVSTVETYTNEDILSESLESLRLSENVLSLGESSYNQSKYIKYLIDQLTTKGTNNINILMIYVYEGENFYEATVLANKVISKLNLEDIKNWVKPISWKGVYGDKEVPTAMEEGIYG